MKKIFVVVLAVAIALIGASAAMAGVVGSKHDLSSALPGGTNQVCVFCHTPHGAAVSQGPLWNRNSANRTFTMYTPLVSNTTPGSTNNVSTASRGCMSCHDGATALNSLFNNPGDGTATAPTTASTYVGAYANIGGGTGNDLSDDHPIAILYRQANSTGEGAIRMPTVNPSDAVAKVTALNAVTGTAGTSTVQCESCHNVHDDVNVPFLRTSNAGSNLCLVCHIK